MTTHPFKSHRDDDGGPNVPCALCFVVRAEHVDPVTPAAALHEYERRLSRLRQFATMDEAWVVYRKEALPATLDPKDEAQIRQGFEAGYPVAMKLAGMALTEVQTMVLRT